MSFAEAVKNIAFKSEVLTSALRRLRVLLHYQRGKPHEADFHFLRDPSFRSGLLLDLGANIGQSALSVAAVQPGLQILSIEANPSCAPGLATTRRLLGAKHSYRLVGVGSEAGLLAFHVPMRSSRMLLEEGTFDLDGLRSPSSVTRIGRQGRDYSLKIINIPLVTVDSMALTPRVVKLDLQGSELAALAGMEETLTRSHPVLMIEVGEQHEEIVELLAGHGYALYHWDGERLRPELGPQTLNAIFIAHGDPARHDS